MTTTTSVADSVRQLSASRERIVQDLSRLTEAECKYPAEWGGTQRTVNFLLRAFSLHELDHLQHLHKLLAARGRHFGEPEILLSKAQALRGELLALVLGLTDEEFDATGPAPEDWSVRQLLEHLTQIDARYESTIKSALEQAAPQRPA